MKRKRKIYICGPMRDNKVNKYKHLNFDAFDTARDKLQAEDWIVISPADVDRLHEGWRKYPPKNFEEGLHIFKACMRRDLNILLEFKVEDAIYILNGWEYSKAGAVELALAKAIGLEFIYEVEKENL